MQLTEWSWRKCGDKEEYVKCQHWPSQIHLELISAPARIIPDPFIGCNEVECQWVAQESWQYRTDFTTLDVEQFLCFDGLDTFATICLNGEVIGRTDNMFRQYCFDVKNQLRSGHNVLLVTLEPVHERGRKLFEGHKQGAISNGDPSRLYVRKAAYHYGWDWGPVLNTCGIWKPVHLCKRKPERPRIYTELSTDLKSAVLRISSLSRSAYIVTPTGTQLDLMRRGSHYEVDVPEVELWWPHTHGEQPLYSLVIDDELPLKFGLRKVELVQYDLEEGKSFFFKINNVPVFCGGSNWIPPDSFHCRDIDYASWIVTAKNGGQNMLRVWGGGIYENDAFYDACDQAGILIWQDLMFACGQYPAYESFRKNVLHEVEDNIIRLRHHPSIVLICGNNEDYAVMETTNLFWQDEDWEKIIESDFPARVLYEHDFPNLVSDLCDLPYWPGSPFGGTKCNDRSIGDCHQWDIWHGSQRPYQEFEDLTARFISEFGMQALPDIKTLNHFLPPDERHPSSRTMTMHNKASNADRRLSLYIAENFRYNTDLASYTYISQLMQHDALSTAYSTSRRLWRGKGKEECGGILVWQFNDAWPCVSWSVVDYFSRPKAGYFAIKRELLSLRLGSKRRCIKVDEQLESRYQTPPQVGMYFGPWRTLIEVWCSNLLLQPVRGTLSITVYDLDSGAELIDYSHDQELTISQNCAIEVLDWEIPSNGVASITLTSEQGVDRIYNWPEPFKAFTFPDRGVRMSRDMEILTFKCERPVHGIYISIERDLEMSDNCFDLCPGEEHRITISGLKSTDEVKYRYYGQYE